MRQIWEQRSGWQKRSAYNLSFKHFTEMVFALGKGHDLVAVGLSSTFPDSAKLLKTVGYHRALSPESIIAMNPELVIHSNDIGPQRSDQMDRWENDRQILLLCSHLYM